MSLRHVPLLLLALLLAPVGVLSAQEDAGHRAEPPSAPDPAPAETPPPPDVSEPPPASEPPDTPVESPEAPEEPSTESPSGRHAVPVDGPVEPHRQPPSRDRNPPPSGGGGDDGGYVPPVEIESDELYEEPVVTGGLPFGLGQLGRGEDAGALDLDVSPGRTQIYIDGQYVGIVDKYDGWPSHLWLESETYEIVFYLDGFRTLARRVTIHPGMTIRLDDRLVPGPSIRPEEFLGR